MNLKNDEGPRDYEVYEDPPFSGDWYFELWGRTYGAFGGEELARLAQSGIIDDVNRAEIDDEPDMAGRYCR